MYITIIIIFLIFQQRFVPVFLVLYLNRPMLGTSVVTKRVSFSLLLTTYLCSIRRSSPSNQLGRIRLVRTPSLVDGLWDWFNDHIRPVLLKPYSESLLRVIRLVLYSILHHNLPHHHHNITFPPPSAIPQLQPQVTAIALTSLYSFLKNY